MRKCPVQERCQHLEVCEIFDTCRSAEHMTDSELVRAGLPPRAQPPDPEMMRRVEQVQERAQVDGDFLRKARAL